jgi:hypothetical protein
VTTLVAGATPLPLEQDFALREERGEGLATAPDGAAGGGRLTLGQLVDSVWEGLHAAGIAGCPACGGRMERAGEVGRCGGCGSALS